MKKVTLIILVFFFLERQNLFAAEFIKNDISYEGRVFYVDTIAIVKPSKERIKEILTNYDHLDLISTSITKSRFIKEDKNGVEVEVTGKGCVLFFCKKITNNQIVEIDKFQISSKTIKEKSNLEIGEMLWQIEDLKNGSGSKITYKAKIKPKFFIPPIIGSVLIKQTLKKESVEIFETINQM